MKIQLSESIDSNVEFARNLLAFITGRTITFQEYINMECREIFGDENKWYAGENLMHPPSNLDCQKNYIDHKADKAFHKKYHYLVERPWQKRAKAYLSFLRNEFALRGRKGNHKRWNKGHELNMSE